MERNALLIAFFIALGQSVIAAKPDCTFDGISLWKACGKENTSFAECEAYGCCFAPDEYLRPRNITWKCLTPASAEIRNGTCVKYTGSACASIMANDTDFVQSLRYIDSTYGINGTDVIFEAFLTMTKITVKEQDCLSLLPQAICRYALPGCLETGEPESICREDCDHVMGICASDMPGLLAIIEYSLITANIKFAHLSLPRCERLRYSYEYPDPNGAKDCKRIYDIDRRRKAEKRRINYIPIAGGVAACGLLILILVAIATVCLKRSRAQRDKLHADDLPFLSAMVSMRDRIQQDVAGDSPLADLLQNGQPGKLVQYPLDKVEYVDDLGEGQFGKVFRGRVFSVRKDEEVTDVAVKCLKVSSGSQAEEAFRQEVTLMSMLDHPNILKLLAVSLEEKPYCMIFEYMVNGDLSDFLRKSGGKFTDSDFIKMAKHIASGMEYLASMRFVHRDLATRNCLVGEKLFVKISDFGMSRDIHSSDYYRVGGEAMLPIRWMPPEAILYGKFTLASDVYSFGVVLWELFTCGLQPYYGYSNDEVVDFIKKGVLLPRPDECPEWIWNIMLLCWKRDIEERITMSKALQLLRGDDDDSVVEDKTAASEAVVGANDSRTASAISPYYDQAAEAAITHGTWDELAVRYQNITGEGIVRGKANAELSVRAANNLAFHNDDDVGAPLERADHGANIPAVVVAMGDPTDSSPTTISRSGSKEKFCVADDSDKSLKSSLKFPLSKSATLKSSASDSRLQVDPALSSKSSKLSNASPSSSPVPSATSFFDRAATLQGRRSIRDVMMNDARYVGTKDIQKKAGKQVPYAGV